MTTLALQHVAIQRGDRLILQGLSFSAVRGELIALMGASGAGKTTLLRAIGGLDPIAAGTIEIGGVRLTPGHLPRGRTLRDLHRSVGLVFQFHHLFANMSVLRNVSLAPQHVLGEDRQTAERRARDLLDMLDVGGLANARPHELSGGEAQRVAIARALAVEPMVLLMDEPTASLDHARRDDLAAALKRLAAHGRTVIVASHDRQFALACADRAVMLDAGRVTRVGATSEVL